MIGMPNYYGVITRPHDRGIPAGIREGRMFAVESEGFSKYGFTPRLYFRHLRRLFPYREQALFVVVPDIVGKAQETITLWSKWAHIIAKFNYPLAFCCQNGQEDAPIPNNPRPDWLFIAGIDGWKGSRHALECMERGRALGLKIHIGRVNSRTRIGYWRSFGADSMDGTSAIYHPTDACNTINQGYNNSVLHFEDSLTDRVWGIDIQDFAEFYDMDCIEDPDRRIDQGMYLHLLYGGQT